MINKIHRTITSLLRKNYCFEAYNTDDYNRLIFSFYHLNSCYNGLCYISKETGNIHIDFQYHTYNKTVEKQLNYLCSNIYKVYKLNQLDFVLSVLDNYKKLATDIYNGKFTFAVAEV